MKIEQHGRRSFTSAESYRFLAIVRLGGRKAGVLEDRAQRPKIYVDIIDQEDLLLPSGRNAFDILRIHVRDRRWIARVDSGPTLKRNPHSHGLVLDQLEQKWGTRQIATARRGLHFVAQPQQPDRAHIAAATL
jgi:hypothetical protein